MATTVDVSTNGVAIGQVPGPLPGAPLRRKRLSGIEQSRCREFAAVSAAGDLAGLHCE